MCNAGTYKSPKDGLLGATQPMIIHTNVADVTRANDKNGQNGEEDSENNNFSYILGSVRLWLLQMLDLRIILRRKIYSDSWLDQQRMVA